MQDSIISNVPTDLLVELEKRFPDRAPSLTDPLDKIRFQSGEVNVVRFLRMHHTRQNETVLGMAPKENQSRVSR